MIVEIVAAAVVALVMFVPSILLSFGVLRGTGLRRAEKTVFGVILGLIVVPFLCLLEFMILGIKFNAMLVLANSLLVLLSALALLVHQKQLVMPSVELKLKKGDYALALVAVIMLVAFYVRFAPAFSTNFFEFDPYYYDKLTERIVNNGFLTTFSSDAYYPLQAFQRYAPHIHYMVASWYSVFQSIVGGAYSKDTLILAAEFYPPLVGALMCFLAFLIFKEEYNEWIALVPAALLAFTPQLVKKLAAGVSEQQPWGIFTAILVFALLILAIRKKSYRLALLASLACTVAVLGSQQYIWPFLVLAVYMGVQAILDFLSDNLDERVLRVEAVAVAGAVVGNALLALYQENVYTQFPTQSTILLVLALAFSAVLTYGSRAVKLASFRKRAAALAVLGVVALAVMFATPLKTVTIDYVAGTAHFAKAGSALSKTIQEEAATSEAFFLSSYGVLNPPLLLEVAAILAALVAVVHLLAKRKTNYAIAWSAAIVAVVFLNKWIDAVLNAVAQASGNTALIEAVTFFVENDVFLYMLVALASSAVIYLLSEKKNKAALLSILIFFPIAYIGLNKLKYMLHLAFALCIAAGYILGEALLATEKLNDWAHLVKNHAKLVKGATIALVVIGGFVVGVQAFGTDKIPGVAASMNELQNTRIPGDWVEVYQWMRTNMPKDSRVMSWWDYGHWTTFFGERNTVLDPNNAQSNFDQGVAHGFVDGSTSDLYSLMEYHHATHVLVDGDLVSKWGALVFLSGSCDKTISPVCPQEKPIQDWEQGPGRSVYESEHYYEYLSVVGTCPKSVSPVELPMLQSNFGAYYCVTNDEMFLVTNDGLNSSLKRKYKIVGRDQITGIDANTSYLFPMAQNQFINANPYLEPFGQHSNVINSAFTRLFLFEQLPGFKLVHRTPNNYVKIFEYTGRPAALPTPVPTAEPSATPAVSITPLPSPAPTQEANATVSPSPASSDSSNSSNRS